MNGAGQPDSPAKPVKQADEISLKELFLKVGEWWCYLLGRWKLILLVVILGAVAGLLWSVLSPVKYKASLTFVLDENDNSTLSSYAGLASQFGVNLGNAGSGSLFQGDNIIQFLQSRLMIENALMTSGSFGGKETTLADNFLSWSSLGKKLKKDPVLKAVHFPIGLSRDQFSLEQNKVMRSVYKNIIDDRLEIVKPDKDLSFIEVTCTSPEEMFSKLFTERLMKEATDFYVNTKTKQIKESVDRLQQQSDSVLQLLNKKTVTTAATQDMNLNPARSITAVPAQLAARDQSILMTTYGELVKNLNIAKISLVQQTPVIQIVDAPRLPLEKMRLSWLKGIILGGFVLGFLAVLILLMRMIYQQVMRD
ncbi:Wzz/FepE/Etk N-terminal domain-containing protein [Compostibacter hankyongensis]|uniref:Polysaccharide chain length determinant N-terminal domain-containing protein n=1 Tax=Compostibacter hankyongensis TaxID=1007089 RepID=A0ABP8FUU1_9BACT